MRKIILMAGLAIASLLYSCSKSSVPTPPPVDTGTNTGNGGNTGGNTGGGNTGGGNIGGGTTMPPTYARVNIYTVGGNGSFDKSNQLVGIGLSDVNVGSMFKTALSTNTNTTTKLVHADGGILDKNLGQWAMHFPNYSGTDTTKQPYLQTIVTDANKNIIEYRTYIVGTDAVLYKYEANKPADKMTVMDFVASFDTKNVQNVLKVEKGNDANYVLPQTIYVNGGTVNYDDTQNKIIATEITNDNQGGIKTGLGNDVRTQLIGVDHATVKNKNGTLDLVVAANDNTILKYFVMNATGKTVTEYDLKFIAGSHLALNGMSLKSFTDNSQTYNAAYVAKTVTTNNQTILKVSVRN